MTLRSLRVLSVEDSEDDAELVLRALRRGGVEPKFFRVQTREDMARALEEGTWDIVLSDYTMPQFSAPEALKLLREKSPDVPFIIVSGTVGEDVAVAAMKLGAQDYLLKGNLVRLVPAIEREVREYAARRRAEQQLRQTEERLRQAQKMEAIGRLAGGVAHDFNNLLSVILSYSAMLSESLPEDDPMRADLQDIHSAGERAADLTRQLLAFSRQQVLQPRILDLNDVVSRATRMLRRLIGEDIDLKTVPAPELGDVALDPGQIEQVILNLAVNARDAMPRGGKLTVETANVRFDAEYAAAHPEVRPGAYVMLAVTDTGTGMDAATQSRIFEPFFTTKQTGKGTGLGLATVFGIVRQSGGHIHVYSEVGRGTTFKLYFPRADRVSLAPPPPVEVRTLHGSETILLVEDDEQLRNLTRTILRKHGYDVIAAASGEEAIEVARSADKAIHLLLTDIVMPRMSGSEVAREIRGLRAGVRVIYMSGYTDQSLVHHGVTDGSIAFLQKPITPEILARKVREVLAAPTERS